MWEENLFNVYSGTKFYNGCLGGQNFENSKCPINCDWKKILYLLKCKVCGKTKYVGKAKTKF